MNTHPQNKTPGDKSKLSYRKKIAILGFALYLTFILLSSIPYIAESQLRSRQAEMDDSYVYHLKFPTDGAQSHYVVERYDDTTIGKIELTYTTASHTLQVETTNLKKLTIDCNSIYYDESLKVFKKQATSEKYYFAYFAEEHDLFTVNVKTDLEIEELRFKYAPEPVLVYVDDIEWWETELNYQFESSDIVLTEVPQGSTGVELYFKERLKPEALFTITGGDSYKEAGKSYGYQNKEITFDASDSTHNADTGTSTKYEWDFDDDGHSTDKIAKHTYTKVGTYNVTLTVTDTYDHEYALFDDMTTTIMIVEPGNDKDEDDMDDTWESNNGLNPNDPNDRDADDDNDGLTNFKEYEHQTNPQLQDSDRDKMPDKWEVDNGLNPILNDANKDLDNDGHSNLDEYKAGTNPKNPSSKPSEEEEDNGLFGLGKVGGIDLVLILIIIIIIVLVLAGIMSRKKGKPEAEALEEELEATEAAPMEAAEEAEEEEEPYECPECGAIIQEDQAECDECGTTLEWDEEGEEEEGEEAPVGEEPAEVEAAKEQEEKEEEEEYECPDCGASISADATSCAQCGVEFE